MRPFDIKDRIVEECFRPQNDTGPWQAGAFDYYIEIFDFRDKGEIDSLCEWLSENCLDNFVVTKTIQEIIAGGTSNNRQAWKNRSRRRTYDPMINIEIRLHQDDIALFRLAWVL